MRYPQYVLGLFTGFCLAGLYFMLPAILDGFRTPAEPPKPKTNFEVVANYQGCDIIRWENSMFAEYKYFMKCSK